MFAFWIAEHRDANKYGLSGFGAVFVDTRAKAFDLMGFTQTQLLLRRLVEKRSILTGDAVTAVVFRNHIQRIWLLGFLANLEPCVVAMEACGGAIKLAAFACSTVLTRAYCLPFTSSPARCCRRTMIGTQRPSPRLRPDRRFLSSELRVLNNLICKPCTVPESVSSTCESSLSTQTRGSGKTAYGGKEAWLRRILWTYNNHGPKRDTEGSPPLEAENGCEVLQADPTKMGEYPSS